MKYILVIGTTNAGKSNTIDAICKRLNPEKIVRVNFNEHKFEDVDLSTEVHNGTFILDVNGKIILVVAGAPTEQKITITMIIEIVIKIKLRIDIAIVAMRSYEKKDGFNTREELKRFGTCIWESEIYQIPSADYKKSPEWQSRIEELTKTLKENL